MLLDNLFLIEKKQIHFHINRTNVIRPIKQNQKSLSSIEIKKPLLAPVRSVVKTRLVFRNQLQLLTQIRCIVRKMQDQECSLEEHQHLVDVYYQVHKTTIQVFDQWIYRRLPIVEDTIRNSPKVLTAKFLGSDRRLFYQHM